VLKSLQDLQLDERERVSDSRGTNTRLVNNVNEVRDTVSDSLSADLRQRPGFQS